MKYLSNNQKVIIFALPKEKVMEYTEKEEELIRAIRKLQKSLS